METYNSTKQIYEIVLLKELIEHCTLHDQIPFWLIEKAESHFKDHKT